MTEIGEGKAVHQRDERAAAKKVSSSPVALPFQRSSTHLVVVLALQLQLLLLPLFLKSPLPLLLSELSLQERLERIPMLES